MKIRIALLIFLIAVMEINANGQSADSPQGESILENIEIGHSPNWSESTHSNRVEPDYEVVFNQSEVLQFNISIDKDNWKAMQDDLEQKLSPHRSRSRGHEEESLSDNPIWVEATITFNGETWEHVGIRYKGNSSLRSTVGSGNNKLSFKLDFDEFEDSYPEIKNQRFFGFKQLNLNNNYNDASLMREKVGADLFREFGLVSAQTAFARVNVDYGEGNQYFGVYTLVEEVDDTVLETQLGNDSGNLYKPDGQGASFASGSFNIEDMEKKSNETEADFSDVQRLYEVINSNDRINHVNTWKTDLEQIFNVKDFLKWLAANTVIQNWDTYGNMYHNYYLYNNPDTGQLNWIPWDNNEALQSGKRGGALSFAPGGNEVGRSWPLIRYLIDDPEYKALLDSYTEQFISEIFSTKKMISTYSHYYKILKEYAYNEEPGYTFLRSEQSFDRAVEELKAHVERRNTAAQNYLDSLGR